MYDHVRMVHYPIGSMYGIYANIWGILMVNITIYSIHGSYIALLTLYDVIGYSGLIYR